MRLHHVQLGAPVGGEDRARQFWVDGLGLTEVPKPPVLAGRGGCWFAGPGVEIHVGIDPTHVPAAKAHPALLLDDVASLDACGERLRALGFEVDDTERQTFPGHLRLHVRDGHGSRIELLATAPGGGAA